VIGDILQPTHLLFVLVIALLVLGPKRLPEVGRSLGRGLRDFRSALTGDEHDEHSITRTMAQTPPPAQPIVPPADAPVAEPAEPFSQPAEPFSQPAEPFSQPAAPVSQPAAPVSQPGEPVGQAAEHVS
jgi:sec-independent protein translocase protein TatA